LQLPELHELAKQFANASDKSDLIKKAEALGLGDDSAK
jgi:hypothetical protein